MGIQASSSPIQSANAGGGRDVFVAKINASGTALVYSTYVGGSGEEFGSGIAVDSSGNAYVTGLTTSANFPGASSSVIQSTLRGGRNSIVAKLNAGGTALVYSTFLGGSGGNEGGNGIAVDSSGNAYVTGYTNSTDFPTTSGAFQRSYGGGFFDAFIAKINAAGTALVYSTYFGGNSWDTGFAIAVDSSGNAYLTGQTSSSNLPGASSSSIGPTLPCCASNAYVAKLNSAGTSLVYSTYLSDNSTSSGDVGAGIAVDSSGNAYVTGEAFGPNLIGASSSPIQSTLKGSQDAFLVKLNAAGTAVVYSTYLGGSGADTGRAIAVDSSGNTYMGGTTWSTDFPGVSSSTIQPVFGGGDADAFVAEVNAAGTALVFSTYLGGAGHDQINSGGLALDGSGNIHVAGSTQSSNFPTTPGALQTTFAGGSSDAFVAKIAKSASTVTTLSSNVNPAIFGQSVMFTANVSSSSGTPTGSVTFSDGSTTLQTVALSSGQAGLTTSTLTVGSHTITAQYNPDTSAFAPSSGTLTERIEYGICTLYDQTKSVKSGAAYPIKLYLCNATGADVSSSTIVLHATSIVGLSTFSGTVEDTGNANPDSDFRFDSTLGPSGGYIFNLSTQGLASGTYNLLFTAGSDPVTHSVPFGVH